MGSITGVFIHGFEPESNARDAGLLKGDVIVEYDGVTDLTADKLQELSATPKSPETIVPVVVVRNGQEHSFSLPSGPLGIVTCSFFSRMRPWIISILWVCLFALVLGSDYIYKGNAVEIATGFYVILSAGWIALILFLILANRKPSSWKQESVGAVALGFVWLYVLFDVTPSIATLAMNAFNRTPVRVEAMFQWYSGGRTCEKSLCLSREGKPNVYLCIQPAKGLFSPLPSLEHLKTGDKIILLGRQSWAGTVIDEIQRAP